MLAPTTLTEIVSIDIEDFSESFLTCSTCLCPFDDEHRKPKLLNCSHTVCSTCLEAIADLPQSLDTGSFRCPICRETIPVPRGGISALPPSFLVNQLIDHMNHRRRDLVPKCTSHQTEELLFCEMCDSVFCPACTVAEDCQNHTVRMSEIMLYKANQCIKTLNRAADNVNREIEALRDNILTATEQLNSSFAQLASLVNERRNELLQVLRTTEDNKRKILMVTLNDDGNFT
ncbi:unnamed protein product [Soboliphyme baturini]|uniref:RING-type domain-containing protein n=1 Tax=Soboliphyme baturini TaxID=241478 RepID=A0A183J2Z6_9BILA|nr:unnamed protein product [Soboliphyme baturini]